MLHFCTFTAKSQCTASKKLGYSSVRLQQLQIAFCSCECTHAMARRDYSFIIHYMWWNIYREFCAQPSSKGWLAPLCWPNCQIMDTASHTSQIPLGKRAQQSHWSSQPSQLTGSEISTSITYDDTGTAHSTTTRQTFLKCLWLPFTLIISVLWSPNNALCPLFSVFSKAKWQHCKLKTDFEKDWRRQWIDNKHEAHDRLTQELKENSFTGEANRWTCLLELKKLRWKNPGTVKPGEKKGEHSEGFHKVWTNDIKERSSNTVSFFGNWKVDWVSCL